MSIAWFIIITCLMAVIQSIIFNKWGLSRVKYQRSFNKEAVFAGEEIEMIDQISNHKLLPIPWLRLESKIDKQLQFLKKQDQEIEIHSEEFHRTLFSLLPFQKITRRHRVRCNKRGYYELKSVSLTIGDVLGLGESFHHVDAVATVVVYPEIIPTDDIPLPSHSWLGEISVRRWIMDDPFIIAGVKKYAYGDPMNSVNWKATARTNSLQVNKRDTTADHELMIYVNFDESEDIWMPIQNTELIEKAISYAASIAHYSISKGIPTGFACNSYLVEPFQENLESNIKKPVRIEPRNGTEQLTFIYDTMAKLCMDKSISFNHLLKEELHNRTNNDILIITFIITESMEESIRILETEGNKVEIMVVDEKIEGVKDEK